MYKKLKNKFGKATALVISLALAVTLTVAGSLAYLVTHTEEVINYFTPARVTCAVEEVFDGTTKSSVKIKNTGTTDAYIRAFYTVYWKKIVKNDDGTIKETLIHSTIPEEDSDYTIEMATYEDSTLNSGKWIKSGEFYYWTKPVGYEDPDNLTGVLIESIEVTGEAPEDGYSLVVDIIAQAVQATPPEAVKEAWGVVISEDKVESASTSN